MVASFVNAYSVTHLLYGWNLVHNPYPCDIPVEEALNSIDGCFTYVFGFKDWTWKSYNPKKINNSLDKLYYGHGYWIKVNCTDLKWIADECGTSCVDLDDDGYCSYDSGGSDCNDQDPYMYPSNQEVEDGKDNDCDGTSDEGWIGPNSVIITEILYDSSGTPDQQYEWFEVYNPHPFIPVNMRNWIIRDQPGSAQEMIVINADVIIPPQGFGVLCNNGGYQYNGGVNCDYEYGFSELSNSADEIILEFYGTTVDEIWYDEAAGWPSATSGSLNLDPGANLLDNNNASNWCNSPEGVEIPNGDEATPGTMNVQCP